jgi:glycosyltransferase involved in cell wall biosynthesis
VKPTVLVITTIPDTLAAFFVPQLRSLDEVGFDVHVVSSPGPALDGLPLGEGVTRHGIPIERQPHVFRDVVSLWRLFRLMRRIRPHVVHAHTPKAGLAGMAAAFLAGIPVRLYTVHGLPLLTRNGWRRHVLETAERTSAALATQCYTVSESVGELLIQHELCPASKLTILGSGSCGGVDVDRFRPGNCGLDVRRSQGIPDDALVLTFVGRLARDKGIAILAKAWPEIAQEIPELHLLLAGEEDDSDPVPEAALQGLREHPRVHFTGTVSSGHMPAVYAASDICILPSFREGLPQTALEAAAAGVPMISTRVSGVVSAVVDGVTGILVPPREVGPLKKAVCQLARGSEQRKRLGEAARNRVVAQFSQDHVNRLWTAEYLKLVAESMDSAELQAWRSDAF